MKVLLTAFGTFVAKDGTVVRCNVGERIAADIASNWERSDCFLRMLLLRADQRVVESAIKQVLALQKPNLAIIMGHARGYRRLTLETRYFNRFIPRIAEESEDSGIIKGDGPEFYDTNIVSAAGLAKYLNSRGIPAALHSGPEGMDYLCNFAGYVAAHYAAGQGAKATKYMLVHIPDPEDLPYEISLEGIRRTIHFLTNPL